MNLENEQILFYLENLQTLLEEANKVIVELKELYENETEGEIIENG